MGELDIDHLTKEFGEETGEHIVAVDDLNIDIEDGEFLILVGPSGCGKSTTLRCIAGLEQPTSGDIVLDGQPVTQRKPKDRHMAMVFQNYALYPHMTARENMAFGLRMTTDLNNDEIDGRVVDAAELMGIEDLLEKKPGELSGGQQQRVALGRAIVRDPEVFLMDEPLSNLDAKLRTQMRTELQDLQQDLDVTTIYVTHDQTEAMTMGDRIAILDGGELQQIGTPNECYKEPNNQFVAGFIGSPSMNFAEATADDGVFQSEGYSVTYDSSSIDGVADGDTVEIGIRPEDIHLTQNSTEAEDPSDPISVETDVLEPMGDEIFVYLKQLLADDDEEGMGDIEEREGLLMSVDPATDIREDESVEIVIDRARIHLFDDSSGDAISHGVVEGSRIDTAGESEDAQAD